MIKARAYKGAGQEGSPGVQESVGNKPSHSQVSSRFGSWSFSGLPNFQKAISGVKTHWIEDFLISLESSWNVDV